jgi:hypothetical protein
VASLSSDQSAYASWCPIPSDSTLRDQDLAACGGANGPAQNASPPIGVSIIGQIQSATALRSAEWARVFRGWSATCRVRRDGAAVAHEDASTTVARDLLSGFPGARRRAALVRRRRSTSPVQRITRRGQTVVVIAQRRLLLLSSSLSAATIGQTWLGWSPPCLAAAEVELPFDAATPAPISS